MAALGDTAFTSVDVPRGFRAERNEALHPVLRRLPDEFIVAMIEGLEGADVITPGKLFSGERGGCVVGVTLRALDPSYRGRWVMWGKSRSVHGFRRRLARRVSHLYALEQVFDRSVEMARAGFPAVPPDEVATAVAAWVADEARTELVLREMRSDWLNRVIDEIGASARPASRAVAASALGLA